MILLFFLIVIICICFLKFIFSIIGGLSKQAGRSQDNLQQDIRTQAIIDVIKQKRDNEDEGSASHEENSSRQKLNNQQKANQITYLISIFLIAILVIFFIVMYFKSK